MAGRQDANAIINVDFELSMGGGGHQGSTGANVVVHGTAVVIKPIQGYVPTGAIGNILFEMAEDQARKP